MPFLTALAVDVATTGTDPRSDAVVEIASVAIRIDLDTGRHDIFQALSNALVDPGREIPATASAVHHLTAEHVRGQPDLTQTLESLCRAASAFRPTVLAAHDAAFEAGFLPDLARTPDDPRWVYTELPTLNSSLPFAAAIPWGAGRGSSVRRMGPYSRRPRPRCDARIHARS